MRLPLAATAVVALAAACGSGGAGDRADAGNADASGAGADASPAPGPLAWRPCSYHPPANRWDDQSSGAGAVDGAGDTLPAECADVEVPLDWNDPDGPAITVFVKHWGTPCAPVTGSGCGKALWILQGGPGGAGVSAAALAFQRGDPSLDIYALDQRGTGRSTYLACPEQEAAGTLDGARISGAEWPPCRAHLAEQWGEDLDHFDITMMAHDLGRMIERARAPGQKDSLLFLGAGRRYVRAMSTRARHFAVWMATGAAILAGCGGPPGGGGDGDAGPDTGALLDEVHAARVGVIPAGLYAAAIAALDRDRVAVARAVVSGDAFCPDCVDLDPSECPDSCERTSVTVSVLDAESGELGEPLLVEQVFPHSFDHAVNQVAMAPLDGGRVGLAWLDCDNSRCNGLAARQSCTARYAVVDVDAGVVGPVATLYEDRYGNIDVVAHPALDQVLVVTGKPYGAYGTGVRAAIVSDSGADVLLPWTALGGADALSPAAVALGDGFAVAVDDRRPLDAPDELPCVASCECSGSIAVDPEVGGLYVHHVAVDTAPRAEPVAIGVAQDGHLEGGHYHAREVIAAIDLGGELAVAAGQAINGDAEIFTRDGDGAWALHHQSDAPIPLWIGMLGAGDRVAWLGSEPQEDGPATVNAIVAGISAGDARARGPLTEPLDSHVFEAAPLVEPGRVATTFLLRGIFDRTPGTIDWQEFDVVRVDASWE